MRDIWYRKQGKSHLCKYVLKKQLKHVICKYLQRFMHMWTWKQVNSLKIKWQVNLIWTLFCFLLYIYFMLYFFNFFSKNEIFSLKNVTWTYLWEKCCKYIRLCYFTKISFLYLHLTQKPVKINLTLSVFY